MKQPKPYLSVIFPAYNEGVRLPPSLREAAWYFKDWPEPVEIIVIENGSNDATYDVAVAASLEIARVGSNLTIRLDHSAPGKGYACRKGIEIADGRYILITDVDLSTPIFETARLIAAIRNDGAALAIGSRKLPRSVVTGLNKRRDLTSKGFTALAGSLTPGIKDTQCGFKMITNEAARWIEPLLTLGGFAWDVELIHVAMQLGYKVLEVPVQWVHDADSRVNIFRDSIKMAGDLIRIRRNSALGRYIP